MPKRHNRRHGAFVNHSGWSPSNDPEWRYRKTLDKDERDRFDGLDGLTQTFIVSEWMRAGEPKEHDLKAADIVQAQGEADLAEVLGDGMIES